jgi:hypothetical protein
MTLAVSVVITFVAAKPINAIRTRAFCPAMAETPSMPAKTAVGASGSTFAPPQSEPSESQPAKRNAQLVAGEADLVESAPDRLLQLSSIPAR